VRPKASCFRRLSHHVYPSISGQAFLNAKGRFSGLFRVAAGFWVIHGAYFCLLARIGVLRPDECSVNAKISDSTSQPEGASPRFFSSNRGLAPCG
jgi:hypothetical protein